MNIVALIGRLTRDPDTRWTAGDNPQAVSRLTIAVDRRFKRDEADFISCVAFGKNAEFIQKYFGKGSKIAIRGHIQTGSYTNKEGKKVFTTDVVIDEQDFVESKKQETQNPQDNQSEGFMDIPDGIEEQLPFL